MIIYRVAIMDNNDVYAEHSEVGYYLHEETAEKIKESTQKEMTYSCYEAYIEEIEVNED
jgi:hypothetical protein